MGSGPLYLCQRPEGGVVQIYNPPKMDLDRKFQGADFQFLKIELVFLNLNFW